MSRPGVPGALAHRAVTTPDRTALVDADDGRRLTYRGLDELAASAAAFLRDRYPDVDRVGTLCAPGPGFVVAFHAAMRLGRTVVGLDPRLTGSALAARADRAGVDLVACDRTHGPAPLDVPTLHTDRLTDDATAEFGDARTPEVTDRQAASTAVVLFTSGTTGEPKGVRLTARNLQASAVASAFRLGVDPGDRWLCCLPVHHMGGLAPVARTALYGTTLVVQRQFGAEVTARVLAEHEVTGVSLVPTQLRRLLDAGAALDALDTVLVGGAALPERLCARALEAGVPVYPTYGTTETASQVATARPSTVRERPGTVGQPLYGVDVTVVADGEPAEPGERGEIVVDGPTVAPGYLDPEVTAAAFGERGLHTGDRGYRDADGRLWVLGRQDDLVLTGGEVVAPGEVVETLRAHAGVVDAAVVGLADPEWGERLAALVVPDGDTDATTLRAHCREHLAGYKCPKELAFADRLPRTSSGTVDREAVRERLRATGG